MLTKSLFLHEICHCTRLQLQVYSINLVKRVLSSKTSAEITEYKNCVKRFICSNWFVLSIFYVGINKFTNVSCSSEAVKTQDRAYLREKAVWNRAPAVLLYVCTWHTCVLQVFERPSCIARKN